MKRLIGLLSSVLLFNILVAQPPSIQISVTVLPPFVSKAEGLLGSPEGNVIVTVTNTARATPILVLV